jgi:hypothetical protein
MVVLITFQTLPRYVCIVTSTKQNYKDDKKVERKAFG